MTNQTRNLVNRIKRSDIYAFRMLFDRYQQNMFNFVYPKLGDISAAEDVVQETFIKVWQNRLGLNADRSIKAYLFTIANNLALNALRHQNVVLKYQDRVASEATTVSDSYGDLERNELRQSLLDALAHLPAAPRRAFILSRFENLTHKEIAKCLDISVKTVENHIGRALKLLRQALRTEYQERKWEE